jgi:membrane-associated phospholipid phosphatase
MMQKLFLSCIVILFFILGAGAQNWDIDITQSINPDNPNSGYWKVMSGSAYFVSAAIPISLLATGLVSHQPDLRRKAYCIFGAQVIEFILSETMKIGFDRKRPAESYPGLIVPYKDVYRYSFPSGHTSLAFATAGSLSIQFKKWYVTVPAYLWAASVGYSRIYLGVHYPSDVLAGAAVGIGSAYLSQWLNNKLFSKRKSSFN